MAYESELSNRLTEISGLTLTAVHVGIVEKEGFKDPNYPSHPVHKYLQDNWSVTVSFEGKSYTTTYFQGIGHRKVGRPVKKEGNRYYHSIYSEFKTEKDACTAQWLQLVEPTLADVMHCLLSDGSCSEGTFEDFCGDMGYDTDSRKALDTYLACQTNGKGLLGVIGRELFNELSRLEH